MNDARSSVIENRFAILTTSVDGEEDLHQERYVPLLVQLWVLHHPNCTTIFVSKHLWVVLCLVYVLDVLLQRGMVGMMKVCRLSPHQGKDLWFKKPQEKLRKAEFSFVFNNCNCRLDAKVLAFKDFLYEKESTDWPSMFHVCFFFNANNKEVANVRILICIDTSDNVAKTLH